MSTPSRDATCDPGEAGTPTSNPADRERLISAGRQRFEQLRSARKARQGGSGASTPLQWEPITPFTPGTHPPVPAFSAGPSPLAQQPRRLFAADEQAPQSAIRLPPSISAASSATSTPASVVGPNADATAERLRADEALVEQNRLQAELRKVQSQCESMEQWAERQAGLRA